MVTPVTVTPTGKKNIAVKGAEVECAKTCDSPETWKDGKLSSVLPISALASVEAPR